MPVVRLVKSSLFVFSHIAVNKVNVLEFSAFAYMHKQKHKQMHFPYHGNILMSVAKMLETPAGSCS